MTLEELYTIIEKRKKELPEDSYAVSLFQQGADRIIQKVGEEAIEVVIAAKNKNREEIIYEVGDLFFHLFVMLIQQNISMDDVLKELGQRHVKKVSNEKITKEILG